MTLHAWVIDSANWREFSTRENIKTIEQYRTSLLTPPPGDLYISNGFEEGGLEETGGVFEGEAYLI